MLVITNKSAPKRVKSAPRSSPHTPPPRCGALAHRPRCSAPMFKMARIGALWRALAQNKRFGVPNVYAECLCLCRMSVPNQNVCAECLCRMSY
jgi:hypothetical protein